MPEGIVRPERAIQSDCLQYRIEAKKPARRHGWNTLAPRSAGQRHLRRPQRLGEVVRGYSDGALRQGNTELPPHLPRHPRVVLGRRRPAALVQTAKNDQIGLLQPRFEETPDRQPGMPAEHRPHDRIGGQRLEQSRKMPAGQRRKVARGIDQLMAEARRRLARRLPPEALAPGFRCGRGEPLCGLDMRCRKTRQRYGIRDEQFRQRAEAGLEPVDKPRQAHSLAGESSPESSQARSGTRSADCLFELTREIAEGDRREPAGGERMLQRGKQGHRSEPAGGQVEDQTQKDARRCPVQRQTGRVVDVDAPAAQLRSNPAGERAIGGDERGGGARRLQLAAEQERDGDRLLLRAGAVVPAQTVEGIQGLRGQPPPRIGGNCRPQCLGNQPYPPRNCSLTVALGRSRTAGEGSEQGKVGKALEPAGGDWVGQAWRPIANLGRRQVERPQQPRHEMLRMSFVLFDCRPLGSIAFAIEAGEDHRALVERGDERKQLGHRRGAAGQSRSDHRMARWRAAPSLGLAFQQAIAPGRGVERPLLGENSGPMLRQDLKKLVDDAPVLRQSLRNQIGDLREARPLGRDPVEKPGEARRERRGLSG